MERKIEQFFQKWKDDKLGKPLVIYGSKQIGKTFSVLNFGKKAYKNVVYFNTDNNTELEDLFRREKIIDKIIVSLSLLSGETILKEDTLIIFDNLVSNNIAKGIKLFGSDKSKYNIIAITSRRDKLAEFKGEELQFKSMNELDFEEYLWAIGEKNLADLIRASFDNRKTCSFHKVALNLFQEYLITGGLLEVINSIPSQLKKENKKFQYGKIGVGRRAKEYEGSINFLVNNQIVYRSYKIRDVKSPLSSYKEVDRFKLYLPDDGILFSMLHMNKRQLETDENLKETLYENHIAKTLVESGYSLFYYQSEGKAEVNFVIQNRLGKIIPIELTTKINSKAKSLSVFLKKYDAEEAYRITENNFSTRKDVRYLPIYAVFCLNTSKM